MCIRDSIWQLPASVVGPYAIEDAELAIDVFKKQEVILNREETYGLFRIETFLMPLLLQMRQTGVRLDVEKLDRTITVVKKRLRKQKAALNKAAGFDVNYWAATSLTALFDKLDLPYPRTPVTKQPSFTKPFLTAHENPTVGLISECRALDKFVGTFLERQMKNQLVGDRLHCMFNQLRGDEYGTVTGRFSSSHPNLQFIPARDPELGPLCRSMFIPEDGCVWGKADYSQIEYRIFAHYAIGPGSNKFRSRYQDDPATDYHQWCADAADIPRRDAKNINFGLLYGMGLKLLARQLGLPPNEAKPFLDEYHKRLPFIRTTSRKALEVAERRGFVKTILKRRRRFHKWEPCDWALKKILDQSQNPSTLKEHIDRTIREDNGVHDYYAGVQRVGTYKALNAIVQGSSADMIKKAMVDCYRSGVFDVLTLHLTVHDELDVSIPNTKKGKRAFDEMLILMRDAIELKVPVMVDAEIGPSWGEVK